MKREEYVERDAAGREDLFYRLASQIEAAASWIDRCPPHYG